MDNSLAIYLKEIGKFPLLNKEQELELGRRIKDEGDEDARQLMINSNLRLVVSIAKPFKNIYTSMSLEDLIAEGTTGLITAVEKYDYTMGYRFSTCAVPWIKQAIMKSIIDKSRVIRIPAHIVQKFNQEKKAYEELTRELGREPDSAEIAKKMGISIEELNDLRTWKQNTVSLSTPINDEEDNTLEDLCEDTHSETPVEYVEKQSQHEFVMKMIRELDDRTKKIFKLRYGLGEEGDDDIYFEEHTLEEIGEILVPHLTRERVRQIIVKTQQELKMKYSKQWESFTPII